MQEAASGNTLGPIWYFNQHFFCVVECNDVARANLVKVFNLLEEFGVVKEGIGSFGRN